ncbi:MAG TPA: flagellar hook basal-body protein [Myxococcales bacterium]|nr:flagellar hook basal-body protein [Myxococcales bacterium]
MSDGIYIGMAGATAREAQLDSIADDLANAQTPGFKAERPVFASVLAQADATRAFPVALAAGTDLRPGPSQPTGNPLDVVPDGARFLAVQSDAGIAYTRDGRLSVDNDGLLRAAGFPVLTASGEPIEVPPGAAPQIAADGTVTANGTTLGKLGLFELQGQVDRLGPSLFQAPDAIAQDGRVQTGAVEMSNHKALDAAVDLVSAQRHFEASMQAIDTYRKLTDRANQLGQVR